MDEIYPISEDTLLLLDHVKCGERVLEIGTGNGAIAIECAKKGSEVIAVDIDKEVVENLQRKARDMNLSIIVKISNLFENVNGKFDTIIFNPPYLPGNAEDIKDLQWAGGGEYGDEIILKFLEEAYFHLEDNGEIYIILSSFNRMDEIKKHPYIFEKIAELKLSFHTIYLYRLRKKLKR